MVTNYPQEIQEIVAPSVGTTTVAPSANHVLARLWKRVQFALCSLHGHDPLLHYDQNRIYLRCASCGHETPGWELDQRRPRVRFHGDPQHHFARRTESYVTRDRKIA